MKTQRLRFFYSVILINLFLVVPSSQIEANSLSAIKSKVANMVSGMVFDFRRNPLPEVPVELLNEFSQSVGRTRTDGGGRYIFTGMGSGKYQIRVIPTRYDFEEQVIEVEIYSLATKGITGGTSSNDSVTQDFYVRPRRGVLGVSGITGTVFVQDVPKPAQKLYEQAIEEFSNKKPLEGSAKLEEAIKIFPAYFLALNRLGFEKFNQEKYSAANEFLARAADANPKNVGTLYLLGYSLHLSKNNSAAIQVLQHALTLNPSVPRILLLMGTTLRVNGQYQEAEKQLVQAKKLDKENMPDIHWQIALLYGNNLKRYNEAAAELELFLKSQPKSRDTENIKKLIQKFKDKAASK